MASTEPTPVPEAAPEPVPATDPAPAEDDPREGRFSIFAAVLLGIAATLTAFSAYQAALSDGDALKGYTESNSNLSDSNYFYTRGDATQGQDYALWVQYAVANTELNDGDRSDSVSTTLYGSMNENLQVAVDWWEETDDALTPFDDESPYENTDFADGEAFGAEATAAFEAGKAADDKGDEFELASVLLALCLFFAGVATLFRRRSVILGLLLFATVVLGLGTAQMFVGLNA